MLAVLAVFGMLTVVALIALVMVAPAMDLVLRPEELPAWWVVPFTPVVLAEIGALVVLVALSGQNLRRVVWCTLSLSVFHFGVAALALSLALGFAVSRGLRPGGETQRRWSSTLLGVGALVALSMLSMFVEPLILVAPACFVGVFWLVALQRSGPPRLMNGRRGTSALLFTSAFGFVLGTAHGVLALGWVGEDFSSEHWLAGVLAVIAVMTAVFGVVGGGPGLRPGALASSQVLTLLVPPVLWPFSYPLPAHSDVPEWVDLEGRPVVPRTAIEKLSRNRESIPASAPAVDHLESRILLDRGTAELMIDTLQRSEEAWVTLGADRRVSVAGEDVAFDELYQALQGIRRYSIVDIRVESRDWTVQELVSVCATIRARGSYCYQVEECCEPELMPP